MSSELLLAVAGNAAGEATYVEDVFSTHLYDGNGGANTIDNGIALTDANVGGSVEFDGTDDRLRFPSSTGFQFGTGDFTVECWAQYDGTSNRGIWQTTSTGDLEGTSSNGLAIVWYQNKIYSWVNGSGTNTGSSAVSANTWYHIAMCRSSGTTKVFLNGTEIRSVADTRDYTLSQIVIGGYNSTPYLMDGYVSNFRVVKGTAVYTSAFTPSTTALTAVSGTSLLTCQGDTPLVDNSSNAHTITVNGDATAKAFGPFTSDTEGKGGLVWIKGRTGLAKYNSLVDSERGNGELLFTDSTSAEVDYGATGVVLNSNGFSVNSNQQNLNGSGEDMCSWTFAKQEKFFDVVTYTGNGTAGNTVSHNLGSVPGFIIVKRTNSTGDWVIYHRSLGGTKFFNFNADPAYTSAIAWNNTAPTDTEFTLGTYTSVNASGGEYVAYLFAHNDDDGEFGEDGDQDIIKCVNSSTSGVEINLGFEPQWVLNKRTDSTGNWRIWDTQRDLSLTSNTELRANTSEEEQKYGAFMKLTPNGFINQTGGNYIYIAIRRGPMKTPESGTEVFAAQNQRDAETGGALAYTSNFPVDMMFRMDRTSSSGTIVLDRLRSPSNYMYTNLTNAEASGFNHRFDEMNGVYTTASYSSANTDYPAVMFRRAPGFFDVVAYEGTGTEPRTVYHNLGVAPEMIWTKRRDSGSLGWVVWHKVLTTNTWLRLDSTQAETSSPAAWGGTFSADNYTIANDPYDAINGSGGDLIAYLFATVPGVSKVGSYSGTSALQVVDCGFSAGARFLIIKRTDSTSSWYVWDTERGIVTGNDPWLLLDSTSAENTTTDYIDPNSSGFELSASSSLNVTGREYIFLAIA